MSTLQLLMHDRMLEDSRRQYREWWLRGEGQFNEHGGRPDAWRNGQENPLGEGCCHGLGTNLVILLMSNGSRGCKRAGWEGARGKWKPGLERTAR